MENYNRIEYAATVPIYIKETQKGRVSNDMINAVSKTYQEIAEKNEKTKKVFSQGEIVVVDNKDAVPDDKLSPQSLYLRSPSEYGKYINEIKTTLVKEDDFKGVENKSDKVRQVMLHEMGHQFNCAFMPDEIRKQLVKRDEIALKKEQKPLTMVDKAIMGKLNDSLKDVYKNDQLSDSDAFKEAYRADLQNFLKLKDTKPEQFQKIQKEINYFIDGVTLDNGIDDEDIIQSDYGRDETFAQLFSFLAGSQDSERNAVQEVFVNCKEVVKSLMKSELDMG